MRHKIKWKIYVMYVQKINKMPDKILQIKENDLTGGKIWCMI